MDTYIAALDQGTTSSRAILFHETGEIAARAQYPFRQIYPQPGWVEHDPMEIWASERRALAEITSHIDPRQVAAIGITSSGTGGPGSLSTTPSSGSAAGRPPSAMS